MQVNGGCGGLRVAQLKEKSVSAANSHQGITRVPVSGQGGTNHEGDDTTHFCDVEVEPN